MIPVREVLPAVLADAIRRAPLSPEKVEFAWRQAAGPAVARVTTVNLRDGVLWVRAPDTVWRREIARSATMLRSRLATLLGPETIGRIEVVAQPT